MHKLLSPPRFSDEEINQTASLLHAILIIMIIATTLAQVVFITIDPAHSSRYLMVIAVIDISGIILLWMNRGGLIYQASMALILLAWGTITVLSATGGGIEAPEATAYFMVVFASGFLLGERAGILTGLVCILTGFSLVMAQNAGILPPTQVHQNSFTIWLIYSIFTVIIVGLQYVATRTIHVTFGRAQEELVERRQAETSLKESEERFQLVLRDSPIFVSITDRSLRYTWTYNPPAELSAMPLVGKRADEVFQIGEAEELMAFQRSVLESGVGARKAFQVGARDRLITYDVSADPLRNNSSQIVGLMVAAVDITERKQLEERQLQSQVQIELHRLLIEHQEAERMRIARDLHDGPVQELVGDLFALHDVIEDIQDPGIRQAVQSIQENLQAQVSSLREFAGELRPPALVKFGLEKAIRSHLESIQEKHPEISMQLEAEPEDPHLPEEVQLPLYRIYQEAMNNIIRHAQATQVIVRFYRDEQSTRLEVQDDGVGFSLPAVWVDLARQGHLGLVGIQERAESIGGKVEVSSRPGGGTCLRVNVPLAKYSQPASPEPAPS